MKITTIETYQLRCPLGEPFGWSQGWIDHRSTGLVKITTDAGVVGWGEGCTGPAAAVIGEIFAPLLLGADPLNRNGLWQQLFAALYNANQAVGFGGSALSAVDIALWDIAGKVAEQPIWALLGGRIRDKVAVYATGLYYTKDEFPNKLLDEARGYVDAGYRGMKTKVGGLPLADDVKRVRAIRRAIGDDVQLMIDANEGYNAATAIQIGRQLADLDLRWFEEPVNAQDLAGYQGVKAALPLALAGGEALRTRYEFAPFLTSRAFDIAQPYVVNVGGISELRTVAMTANTLGIQVNPHVWGSPIMIAATLQVTATLPPCPPARNPQPFAQEPVMEFDRTPSAIREELCREPFKQVDGFVAVPEGPGLGVVVDETALNRLTVDRKNYSTS
jgi:D-galactarolactone cycloisomerase